MPRPKRFDLVEVVVIAGVAATLVAWVSFWYLGAMSPLFGITGAAQDIATIEVTPLADRYGPTHYSQFAEEWIVRDAFGDRRGGVFVDVGASYYRHNSVTYYLDTVLEWTGVAIDANQEFAADYATHRPRTRFVAAFVSDRDDESVTLHIPRFRPLMASGTPTSTAHESREVATATLNRILREAEVSAFDFLNLDIEGFETQALAGLDLERFRPSFVCVEAYPVGRQKILDYFQARGYVVVGKYLRADSLNLYFRPAASSAAERPSP